MLPYTNGNAMMFNPPVLHNEDLFFFFNVSLSFLLFTSSFCDNHIVEDVLYYSPDKTKCMKTFITLFTAILLTSIAFAYPMQSRLTISTMSSAGIRVMIDGRNYNDRNRAQNDLLITDIRPGVHVLKIYKYKTSRGANDRYNVNGQLIYAGNITVRSGYHTDITINRFGKAFIDERQINGGYYAEDYEDNGGQWGSNNNYLQAMSAGDFEQSKRAIKQESFDRTKVVIAKQTIDGNNFSSAQVKELVKLFSFESSRLDIAKYCFSHCIDKGNYFIVNEAFDFSSSKEELAKYVQLNR